MKVELHLQKLNSHFYYIEVNCALFINNFDLLLLLLILIIYCCKITINNCNPIVLGSIYPLLYSRMDVYAYYQSEVL